MSDIPEAEATRKLREAEEAKKAASAAGGNTQVIEKIVEKEVYPSDVRKVVEEARQEEKTKLYDKIRRAEAIEETNKELKKSNELLTAENAQLKTQLTEAEKKKKTKKAGEEDDNAAHEGVDVDSIIAATVQATQAAMEKKHAADMSALQGQIASLTASLSGDRLTTLRNQLIAEANGEIIAGMVFGSTEEELRINAVNAKAEYKKIAHKIGGANAVPASHGNGTPAAASTAVPAADGTLQPAAPTPVGRGPILDGGAYTQSSEVDRLAAEVKGMTPKEYAKVRLSVLAKLKKNVRPPANPLLGR